MNPRAILLVLCLGQAAVSAMSGEDGPKTAKLLDRSKYGEGGWELTMDRRTGDGLRFESGSFRPGMCAGAVGEIQDLGPCDLAKAKPPRLRNLSDYPKGVKPVAGHLYVVHVEGHGGALEEQYLLVHVDAMAAEDRCEVSWKLIPVPAGPPGPSNLKSSVEGGHPRLTWDPPQKGEGPGPKGYRVSLVGVEKSSSVVNKTAFTFKGKVAVNSLQVFCISAIYPDGESEPAFAALSLNPVWKSGIFSLNPAAKEGFSFTLDMVRSGADLQDADVKARAARDGSLLVESDRGISGLPARDPACCPPPPAKAGAGHDLSCDPRKPETCLMAVGSSEGGVASVRLLQADRKKATFAYLYCPPAP